jgi:NADPH-dependent F420 reductase
MRIALLGGTGDIGQGLALRWAHDTDHDVVVGSRAASRARSKAEEYATELESRGVDVGIEGYENPRAVENADLVVLAVPPYYVTDTVDAVAEHLADDAVVVSPAVGMDRHDGGVTYDPPGVGSVTALAADAAPEDVPVVGAFHNLPADRLANLDADLGIDTLVVGDDGDAKDTVRRVGAGIVDLEVLDAGPLANAPVVESLTPLLVDVAMHNEGLHDLGVQFN